MSDNHDLHDERISRLYKMGDGTEPPEHIDSKIRQAARDAAPVNKRNYTWPSLATAAVLVLSVSLVLKVLNQQPVEESVLEPLSVDEHVATPEVEQRKGEAKTVREGFKAKRLRMAPAPQLMEKDTQGAAQFDVAPAATVGGVTSSSIQQLDCSDVALPDTDSKQEWAKQYQQAMQQGQLQTARCLQQAYRTRFNQAMPKPAK